MKGFDFINQNRIEIYIIKSMAILSVVSAHCYKLPIDQNGFPMYCALLLRNFGVLGALCFFIISGYLYHPEKYTAKQMIIHKGKTIMLPWFVAGLCAVVLKKHDFVRSIQYILGYKSMLYFLPMLIVCFVFFYFPMMRKKNICIALILVTFVSTIWFDDFLYQLFLLPFGFNPEEWTGYLNPLNWIGYFALGVLGQTEINCWRKFLYSRATAILVSFVFIATLVYQLIMESPGSYFYGGGCLLVRTSGVILMLSWANLIGRKIENSHDVLTKTFTEIGKDSYSIYLWHFLPLHFIIALFNLPILINWVIIRPFVTVTIVAGGDILLRRISKYNNGKTLLQVFGVR